MNGYKPNQVHLSLPLSTSRLQVMIYELADFVQGFLTEHNVPPSRSFHEEMLKNHRRQQERLALEEQQRIDQRRQQEEQMVRHSHSDILVQ